MKFTGFAIVYSLSLFLGASISAGLSGPSQSPGVQLGPRHASDWRLYSSLPLQWWSGAIELKLREGVRGSLRDNQIWMETRLGSTGLNLEKLVPGVFVTGSVQGFGIRPAVLEELRSQGRRNCQCELADLNLYFRFSIELNFQRLPSLLRLLNEIPEVELAYPVPKNVAPPDDIPPATPDYHSLQTYKGPAPGGVDIDYANTLPGGKGENIPVCDIEGNWVKEHEDLESCLNALLPGGGTPYLTDPLYIGHGTAVLGILFADDNGYGVTGMIPQASCHFSPDTSLEYQYDPARAIITATQALEPPAAILLEMQTPFQTQEDFIPIEWIPGVYDAIRQAVAKGLVVVEAAANGNQNLDDAQFGGRFNRAQSDSGAILVGAGNSATSYLPRGRQPYSNYGSRVDVQGWGENVVTTGYPGELFGSGDDRQSYTAVFAGTSSASPIVTACVAALLGIQKAAGGQPMSPSDLRQLLTATGTPQPDFEPEHIGPLPDMKKAIAVIWKAECGDGYCTGDESFDDCPEDCPPVPTCGLIPKGGRVVDESEELCFQKEGTAEFWHSENAGNGNSLLWTYTSAEKRDNAAKWLFRFEQGGNYRLEAYLTVPWNQSKQANYVIQHNGRQDSKRLDQSAAAGWVAIGDYDFAAGKDQWVGLDDFTGEPYVDPNSGRIVFDAVRLTRLDPVEETSDGGGEVLSEQGKDDGSMGDLSESSIDGALEVTDLLPNDPGGCGCSQAGSAIEFMGLMILALFGLAYPRNCD